MSDGPLQVLIPGPSTPRLVAGVPPCVRAAHRVAEEIPGSTVVLCGVDAKFRRQWRAQLSGVNVQETVDPNRPVLALVSDGFPEPGALKRFVERARPEARPARWLSRGLPAAGYVPRPEEAVKCGDIVETALRVLDNGGEAVLFPGWVPASTRETAAEAERALVAALPKDTDGYIAKLDRRLSIALSRFLLRFPVTPNQITTASLVLGLLGAWWLASGAYARTLSGAALLWFCCLLDGCDGEVARLKLLCSPSGAAYDLWADHVAHLATFVAIPFGVHRARPGLSFRLPGALLVSGFLASMFTVWYLVLRKPQNERGPYALLIERVASRDYVYLIVLAALLGRLDWFLYAAGAGSHVFWIALWLLPMAPRAAATPSPKTSA